METLTKLAFPSVGLFLTLAFGVWLTRVGKPYNSLLFSIHKLLALALVIGAAIQFAGPLKTAAWPVLAGLVLAALGVIGLFVSGALLSLNKLDYALMRNLHRLGAALIVTALVLVGYGIGR